MRARQILKYHFALLGLFLCLLPITAFAQSLEVTLKEVEGDVEVRFPDRLDWEKAMMGMRLKEGTDVRTGPFSRATLHFEDYSVSIVDSFSYINIGKFSQTQTGIVASLDLKVGAIISSNVKRDPKSPIDYKVSTPTLVASIRGTEINRIIAGQLFRDKVEMGKEGKLEVADEIGNVRIVSSKENTNSQLARSADLFTRDSVVSFAPLGSSDVEVREAVNNLTRLASLASDLPQNLTLPSPSSIDQNLGNPNPSLSSAGSQSQLFSTPMDIVLRWGATPRDLDSHLTGPGFHVYYAAMGSSSSFPHAFLHKDTTSGFGPETITINQLLSGTYRYSVHDFTNRLSSDSAALSNSSANVRVTDPSGQVKEYVITPNQGGTLWTVFELNGATGQITDVNGMSFHQDPSTIP